MGWVDSFVDMGIPRSLLTGILGGLQIFCMFAIPAILIVIVTVTIINWRAERQMKKFTHGDFQEVLSKREQIISDIILLFDAIEHSAKVLSEIEVSNATKRKGTKTKQLVTPPP